MLEKFDPTKLEKPAKQEDNTLEERAARYIDSIRKDKMETEDENVVENPVINEPRQPTLEEIKVIRAQILKMSQGNYRLKLYEIAQ